MVYIIRNRLYVYLRQGGYAFIVVCLSVCLLATLHKNLRTDLHEIFREGWQSANEQMIKFGGDPDPESGYGSISRHW